MAIEYGMIPEDLADYRQENFCVFDLETAERESTLDTEMEVNGVHKIISIGVSSSLPIESKYFERKSSAPVHSTELVAEFLDYLFEAEKVYHNTIPEEILDAFSEIDDEYTDDVCDKVKVERELRKYGAMPTYGFNSGMLIYDFYLFMSYDPCHMTHII